MSSLERSMWGTLALWTINKLLACNFSKTRITYLSSWFTKCCPLHVPPIVYQKLLFINSSVVCAMQTMSASRVDTNFNVWRNTSDQKSETITNNFKILKSVRANSTVWFLQSLLFVNSNPNWTNRVIRPVGSHLFNYFTLKYLLSFLSP